MGFANVFRKAAIGAAVVVGGGMAAYGFSMLDDATYPVEKGERYLADEGYTDIKGGEQAIFHNCGKSVYARKFEVTSPDSGKTEARTVCYYPLAGPGAPRTGK